jgi:hypothetical protein
LNGATNRRKGNQAEVAVVNCLKKHGYTAVTSRNARGGAQMGGDLISDFPAVIEVKNHAKLDLAGWWRQAVAQADGQPAIVIHKRVGHSNPENWWVTMDLAALISLIRLVSRGTR